MLVNELVGKIIKSMIVISEFNEVSPHSEFNKVSPHSWEPALRFYLLF
jgi:hypothetical protein